MFSFSTCKKENKEIVSESFNYFPSNVGHELIYDVDSIVKDDFDNSTDTFQFQIKEIIESVFTDIEGRPTLRIERYKRTNSSQAWIIHKVWTANVNSFNAEKKEDNITYVKLIFPSKLNKTWNGNSKNCLGEELYEITSLNDPDVQNNLVFDSTLNVLHSDEDDHFYRKDYAVEKYANGIGLYYKIDFRGYYKGDPYPYPTLYDSLENYIYYSEKLISFNN
ncbi:MAG: hypothetical protein ACHQNT_09325 [Bacteroidia bacterium]